MAQRKPKGWTEDNQPHDMVQGGGKEFEKAVLTQGKTSQKPANITGKPKVTKQAVHSKAVRQDF